MTKVKVIKELAGHKYKYVWHCADIHIRLQSRHDEYRSCFRRMFRYLAEQRKMGREGIVVVCGDILHSKCELTPEAMALVQYFFEGLTYPVICIAGNHDANLSNSDRLDALSPILSKLPNVYYLRDTGLYRAGNIVFGVSSVFDGERIDPPEQEKGVHRIVLYHGQVNGCITDVGTRLASERTVEDFRGWDYGMFGDIHKYQIMAPRMAFPGSLIQQNFAESGFHGFLRWELGQDEPHRIRLRNHWGFHRLRVVDGELQDDGEVSKYPRIELHVESGTPEQVAKIERQLRKDYDVESFEVIPAEDSSAKQMDTLKALTMNSFLPSKVLARYLGSLKVPDDQVERIGKMHHKWRSELVDNDKAVTAGRWRPIRMLFHNMFTYDGSWQVRFPEGLCGRFGMNGTGKSSTIDIMLLLLFDQTVRSDKRANIVTEGEKDFRGMIEFIHAGTRYFVYRQGSMSSRGLNVKTRFWRINRKGGVDDLTGKDRLDTNRAIEAVIGGYQETMNIGVMLQKSGTGFVDETPAKRKERINRILNLDKFDRIAERIGETKRQVNAELKVLGNTDPNERFDAEEQYDKLKTSIAETKARLEKLERIRRKAGDGILSAINDAPAELKSLQKKLDQYKKELATLPKSSGNAVHLRELQQELVHSEELERSLQWRWQPGHVGEMIAELDMIRKQWDMGGCEIMNTAWQSRSDIEERDRLNREIEQCQEQVAKLKNHKYDPKCKYCTGNSFVKQALEDKKRLKELGQQATDLGLSQPPVVMSNHYDKFLTDADRYRALLDQIYNVDKLTGAIPIPLAHFKEWVRRGPKLYVDVLKEQIEHELTCLEYVAERRELEDKISRTRERIEVLERYIDLDMDQNIRDHERLSQRLLQNTEKYGMLKARLAELRKNGDRVKEVTEQLDDLTIYGNAVSRDGIPKQLAAQLIPRLEREINSVIGQITDMRISIDPITASMAIKSRGGSASNLDAQMCCGSEKLIIELSLRAVIATMSCASAPNMLILDESLNDFDVEKRSSLEGLFNTMCRHFESVLLITHQDFVKAIVNKQIMPKGKVDWKAELAAMPTGSPA